MREYSAFLLQTVHERTWGPIPKAKSCNENCNENCNKNCNEISYTGKLGKVSSLHCTCPRIQIESHYNFHYNFRYNFFPSESGPWSGTPLVVYFMTYPRRLGATIELRSGAIDIEMSRTQHGTHTYMSHLDTVQRLIPPY